MSMLTVGLVFGVGLLLLIGILENASAAWLDGI